MKESPIEMTYETKFLGIIKNGPIILTIQEIKYQNQLVYFTNVDHDVFMILEEPN